MLTKRKRIMGVIPELRSPEEKLHFCNNQSIYGIRHVTLTNPSLYSLTTLKCSKTICWNLGYFFLPKSFWNKLALTLKWEIILSHRMWTLAEENVSFSNSLLVLYLLFSRYTLHSHRAENTVPPRRKGESTLNISISVKHTELWDLLWSHGTLKSMALLRSCYGWMTDII